MKLTIPNLLSLFRMGLVPLFIIAVLNGDSGKALVLFVVAGISDALDGALARWLDQQSLLGTYLDPIADKLLLTSAYVTLSIHAIHDAGSARAVTTLPDISGTFLVLLAISHGAYLAAKVPSKAGDPLVESVAQRRAAPATG